jgi:hypothetical protein
MRKFVFAALATLLVLSAPARGAQFQVENGSYFVLGDFGPDGHIVGTVSFQIASGGTLIPGSVTDPLNGPYWGYSIDVVANSFGRVQGCSSSQLGAMCGRTLVNTPAFDVFDADGDGIGHLFVSGGASIFGPTTPIDLDVFISLPPGFTVATVVAVPELSTWAMLLIGFLGIGCATYRRQFAAGPPSALRVS